MRTVLILLAVSALAHPAGAQDLQALALQQTQDLEMQRAMDRQRDVVLHNELMVLDARVRTDQAVRDLQDQRANPPLRSLPALGAAPIDPQAYAAIPDDRLAASNARVRAAARNTR